MNPVARQQIMSRFRPIAPKPAAAAIAPPPLASIRKQRGKKKRSSLPARSPIASAAAAGEQQSLQRCKSWSPVELKLLPDSSLSSPTSSNFWPGRDESSSSTLPNEQTQLCLGSSSSSSFSFSKSGKNLQEQVGLAQQHKQQHSDHLTELPDVTTANAAGAASACRNLRIVSSGCGKLKLSCSSSMFKLSSGVEELRFLELAYASCQEPVAITNELNQLLWCNPVLRASYGELQRATPVPISSFLLQSKARVLVWSFSGFTLQDGLVSSSFKVARPRPLRPSPTSAATMAATADSFSYIPAAACVNSSV